ncbi:probable pectinesterase 29 [Impatiens glandulifera]|uniref:probable pectinesterase 29 n=1 Tax=Impatiens glandulifera TaxID=253017 RepID=UPI001FB0CFD3|nr:probable pectinesterase 29 [Impatiens glandulifera]
MGYLDVFSIVVVLTLFLGSCLAYDFASTVFVDKSGKGQFTTIQVAINSVPLGNNKWFHIVVTPGIYYEKVSIPAEKEYIFLDGGDSSQTTVSWDDSNGGASSTFSSSANNFVAKGITFVNSYNVKQRTNITQALAIIIYGDKNAFYNCGFIGYQDTLCDFMGRHYYKSCYIEGVTDFIWGLGQSVFEDCRINVSAEPGSLGYITAQGQSSEHDSNGFVFSKSNVYGTGQAFLGRAYGTFSRVVFMESTFSSVVYPAGWDPWVHQGEENKLTFVEAGCQGSGANISHRVPWAKIESVNNTLELKNFSTDNFIDKDGWITDTRFE